MRAAVLEAPGQFQVVDRPQPDLIPGSALVRMTAVHVSGPTKAIVAGQSILPLPIPYVLGTGGVGIIEAVAEDVDGLRAGMRVLCDPFIATPNGAAHADWVIVGWFAAPTEIAARRQARYRDGSLAHIARFPAANCTPIPANVTQTDAQLSFLKYTCIGYGALQRAAMRPGATVLVHGATGSLGTATVLAALAMGASRVYAAGRRRDALEALTFIAPERTQALVIGTDTCEPVDILIDVVAAPETSEPTQAAMRCVRAGGTIVFLGGVRAPVPLDYGDLLVRSVTIAGSFMYDAGAHAMLLRMAMAGTLPLDALDISTYRLADVGNAVEAAATIRRGLDVVVVEPGGG